MTLDDLPTPALILDLERVERNCERMRLRSVQLGVALRPHMKTAKSPEVARLATGGTGPITVSTVAEAGFFADAGFADIFYAVGIAATKIGALAEIQSRHGCRIALVADTVAAVRAAANEAEGVGASFAMMIEVDCGGGRGGVPADGPELLEIGDAIERSSSLDLAGVMTHAGHSYDVSSIDEIVAIAEDERSAVVGAARRLREAGHEVRTVSVGSTPTALFARSLDGVSEMRPGVYTLFDLDQAGRGCCAVDDIAVSVLASVIGHNPRARRLLIDAGALALSKDVSASRHGAGSGYGLVCTMDGVPIPGLRVASVQQEHGLIECDLGPDEVARLYPPGTRLRILPNHACMTAAPYDLYHLVRGADQNVIGDWKKAGGW